jgi:hypothetical protein
MNCARELRIGTDVGNEGFLEAGARDKHSVTGTNVCGSTVTVKSA